MRSGKNFTTYVLSATMLATTFSGIPAYELQAKNCEEYSTEQDALVADTLQVPGQVQLDYIPEFGDDYIGFSWQQEPTAESYYVYRKTNTSEWMKIAETKETYYKDQTLRENVTYTYTVSGVNAAGEGSYGENQLPVLLVGKPSEVQLKPATAHNNYISVEWIHDLDQEIDKYNIYRRTDDSEWDLMDTIYPTDWVDGVSYFDTKYDDWFVSEGVTYYYAVAAENFEGEGEYGKKYVSAKLGQETESVIIDEQNFPCEEFRVYVSTNFDSDRDGVLTTQEIADAHYIECVCSDYTGIEFFTELTDLVIECTYTQSIDHLDISKNTKLKVLSLQQVNLNGNLDVSKNTNLEVLRFKGMESFYWSWYTCNVGQVDLSKNVNLQELDCTNSNTKVLDVSHCPKLRVLKCGWNLELADLDISNNPLVETLHIGNTGISNIDIGHLKNLKVLNIQDNYTITEKYGTFITPGNPRNLNIDWSKNVGLTELYCSKFVTCKIDTETLANLEVLDCFSYDADVTLNLLNNAKLKSLKVIAHGKTANDYSSYNVDFSTLTNLENLYVSGVDIKSLDLRTSKNLNTLVCTGNALTSLNVKNLTKLVSLDCSYNQIKQLDLSGLTNLTQLECSGNKLAYLDLSGNKNIQEFYAYGNEAIVASRTVDLTMYPGMDATRITDISGGVISGNKLTINADSNEAAYSYDCGNGFSANFSLVYRDIPKMVTDLTANAYDESIEVYWSPDRNVELYYVYRRTADTKWTKLGETVYSSWNDCTAIGGITYYYTVVAVNEIGKSSYDKNGVAATITALPGSVKLLAPTIGDTSITVNWNVTPTANAYIVYRHAKGEKWTKIGTTRATSFVDKTAIGGVNYAYTVRSMSGNGSATVYDKTGVIAKITARPGKVTLLAPTIGKTAIKVNWKGTLTASSYVIYRHAKGESWTKIGTSTTTSYVDTTAVGGKNYAYTVKAVNGNGSSTSYDKTGVIAKITALPGITTMVGATAYTGYIQVKWKATPTASSYAVYRKTAGGKWTKIGTTTKTAYNDKTAVKGTTYYYTVIATNGNGACKTYDKTGVSATAK